MSTPFIAVLNTLNDFFTPPLLDFKNLINVAEHKRILCERERAIKQDHSTHGKSGDAYLSALHDYFLTHLESVIRGIYENALNKTLAEKIKITTSQLEQCVKDAQKHFMAIYLERMQCYNVGMMINHCREDFFTKWARFEAAATHNVKNQLAKESREYKAHLRQHRFWSEWRLNFLRNVAAIIAATLTIGWSIWKFFS